MTEELAAPRRPRRENALLALARIPVVRRMWAAITFSSLGDWLGLLALTAFAGELAGDGYAEQNFAIAGVLFLRVLPAVVIGPLAGYVADRLDRRLALVLGLGASASDSAATLEPPTAGAEESFMLVWDSEEDAVGNADNIRWLFRKCKVTGNISIARRKAPNKATLPVEIKCSKPAGAEAFTVFPNADGLV